MAFDDNGLDDYVDVAQRIADLRAVHPEGSLQPLDPREPFRIMQVPSPWCVECIGRRSVKDGREQRGGRWVDKWKQCPRCKGTGTRGEGEPDFDVFIVYTAVAYRSPDDRKPGIGVAWEPYPGRTPYTKASEVMNAETSAQGRAIVAALASDSKAGVASREEVRNRRAERLSTTPPDDPWLDQPPGPAPEFPDPPPDRRRGRGATAKPQQETPVTGGKTGPSSAPANGDPNGRPTRAGHAAGSVSTAARVPPPDAPAAGNRSGGLTGVIRAHFKRLGYDDRDPADKEERLVYTARLAGVDAEGFASTNQLDDDERRRVVATLEKCKDRATLHEVMAEKAAAAAGTADSP